jgi:hypothetical protein
MFFDKPWHDTREIRSLEIGVIRKAVSTSRQITSANQSPGDEATALRDWQPERPVVRLARTEKRFPTSFIPISDFAAAPPAHREIRQNNENVKVPRLEHRTAKADAR